MALTPLTTALRRELQAGLAIPACPLALNAQRRWDERHQRALVRYYVAAGAGGIAAAVHTTQFALRDPQHGLFRPLLELVAGEMGATEAGRERLRITGVCGATPQAVDEAGWAANTGYHAALLSLGAWRTAPEADVLEHVAEVGSILPIIGFYLQPAVGGRVLTPAFWRRLAELECVIAIKIAPFNRYQTLDVMRAVAESGRTDLALYTGNDDHIVGDLLTPYRFVVDGRTLERRMVGGLLGHWAVWTRTAVALHAECRRVAESGAAIPREFLVRGQAVTDANAAFFDAAHGFAGCIAGLHEVLRRQGLLEGTWCLNPHETLSPGQSEEIDRVLAAYPDLSDDAFVAQHRDAWLR